MPWTPNRIVGLSIAVPALVLLVVARLQLGRAFSVQAKASTLVTTGLYSRIRNPIYVFGMPSSSGIIIWIGSPWLLLIFVDSHSHANRAQPERSESPRGEIWTTNTLPIGKRPGSDSIFA